MADVMRQITVSALQWARPPSNNLPECTGLPLLPFEAFCDGFEGWWSIATITSQSREQSE